MRVKLGHLSPSAPFAKGRESKGLGGAQRKEKPAKEPSVGAV